MGDGQDFGRNERGGGNLTKKVFQICTRIKTFDVGGTLVPPKFFIFLCLQLLSNTTIYYY